MSYLHIAMLRNSHKHSSQVTIKVIAQLLQIQYILTINKPTIMEISTTVLKYQSMQVSLCSFLHLRLTNHLFQPKLPTTEILVTSMCSQRIQLQPKSSLTSIQLFLECLTKSFLSIKAHIIFSPPPPPSIFQSTLFMGLCKPRDKHSIYTYTFYLITYLYLHGFQ